MTRAREIDTAARLLDAAERAFAEQGFEGSSLREITAEADVNLAAANYHFGSKEDLFVAVLSRRMEPLNLERLRRLDEAETQANGAPLEVDLILRILIEPMLRSGADGGRGGRKGGDCALRLIGRMQSESEEMWKRIAEGPLREIRRRIMAALRSALPRCPEAELALRMHFAMGVVKSVASDQHRLRVMSGGLCDPDDIEGVTDGLIRFLSAGLRAPPPRAARTAQANKTSRRKPAKSSRP